LVFAKVPIILGLLPLLRQSLGGFWQKAGGSCRVSEFFSIFFGEFQKKPKQRAGPKERFSPHNQIETMAKGTEIDKLDKQILSILMRNAKKPYTDIAKQLYVSGGTIHVRMKKMEDAGIVKGYSLNVDPASLGYDITAFLGVYLDKSSLYDDVADELEKIPEVVAAHYTTGLYSIFATIVCRDTKHLREVLHDKIQKIEGIQRTETFISLQESINRPIDITGEGQENSADE
jgi:Lrp/AsnC family transcriptional regulator for asnA, asnC and gidA